MEKDLSKISGVELLPEEIRKEFKPRKKILILSTSILFIILVFLISFFGNNIYQKSKENELKNLQEKSKKTAIEIDGLKKEKEEASVLQVKLSQIKNLLDKHFYLTKFFSIIEKTTIDNVYYSSIAVSGNGKVSLSAQAKDYSSVARQFLALQETKEIEDVKITGAGGKQGEINFEIELIFKEEAFLKNQ